MIRSLTKPIFTAASLFLVTNCLHAAVMSFDSLVNIGGIPGVYVEDGITKQRE